MASLAHRKLRAPQEDGAALIDPPLSEVAALVAANQAAAKRRDEQLGLPNGFCATARRQLLRGASGNEEGPSEIDVGRPLIMSGHQPVLFHPGVWFKNFLLSSIAKQVGGRAVNLVVDNDTIRTASIKVPSSDAGVPLVVDVPFDAQGEEIPWESRSLIEPELFASFPARVHTALEELPGRSKLGTDILLDRLWPNAIETRRRTIAEGEQILRNACHPPPEHDDVVKALSEGHARIGDCLAEARHGVEREIGLSTCEITISSLTFWKPFSDFAELLIGRHRELWESYNTAIANYRRANHVRSHSHPVPDLARDGEWFELPLWLWTHSPRRQRVFVRQVGGSWELTDRHTVIIGPQASGSRNGLNCLHTALVDGAIIRPRAIVTTMYARLVLSDLFIHGIGGAKYDELTDEIIRRFFGIEPPRYLTATATFRLPIDRPHVTAEDVRHVARRIRDLRYRPESFVSDPLLAREPALTQRLEALAHEKRQYLSSHRVRRGSRDNFAGLDRLNRAMHDLLRPIEEQIRREHAERLEQARRARLLGSREFSFVLFPEEYLVPRLLELSKVPA